MRGSPNEALGHAGAHFNPPISPSSLEAITSPFPASPQLAGQVSAASTGTNKGLWNCLTSCLSGTPSSLAITSSGGPWRALEGYEECPEGRFVKTWHSGEKKTTSLVVYKPGPRHQSAYAGTMRNYVVSVSEQHNNSTVI